MTTFASAKLSAKGYCNTQCIFAIDNPKHIQCLLYSQLIPSEDYNRLLSDENGLEALLPCVLTLEEDD